LSIHERIALRKILRQTHERVVNRLVAVRMVFADHVADDARALLETRSGIEFQLLHRPQEAAMHGLEAVAHVGQRARHDRGQRIGQIAFAQRVLEIDGADIGGKTGGHVESVLVGQRVGSGGKDLRQRS